MPNQDGFTPLDMTQTCTKQVFTQNTYSGVITSQILSVSSTEINSCQNPWNYYGANIADIVIVLCFAWLIFRFIKT